jgi:hypothetical protein
MKFASVYNVDFPFKKAEAIAFKINNGGEGGQTLGGTSAVPVEVVPSPIQVNPV